jgi:hypothetical protein
MPAQDHPIDLVTLEEIERVLAETNFATIEDLIGRGGLEPMAAALAAVPPRRSAPASGAGDGLAPLPRRR